MTDRTKYIVLGTVRFNQLSGRPVYIKMLADDFDYGRFDPFNNTFFPIDLINAVEGVAQLVEAGLLEYVYRGVSGEAYSDSTRIRLTESGWKFIEYYEAPVLAELGNAYMAIKIKYNNYNRMRTEKKTLPDGGRSNG
jgi:hypothetical protein